MSGVDSQISVVLPGLPYPLGATWDGQGVNFALFSEHAERVELCVFDAEGRQQIKRITMPERTEQVWHCYLPEARPGLLYGYRVHGPYDPDAGHRFNPNKLLLDPYARELAGTFGASDMQYGYTVGHKSADLSFDKRDSASAMPKCRVIDSAFAWSDDKRQPVPWSDTVIYELHVKGYSQLHPLVPESLRGKYGGLCSAPVVEHLRSLGVTAVELLPIHAFVDDRRLVDAGMRNYWGYNSIGFFAPESRYAEANCVVEFKTMVDELHNAGLEVILDVVYNHTAEGNELGPTFSFRGLDNAAYYRLVDDDPRHYLDFTGCGNSLDTTKPRALQLVMDSLRYWVVDMHVDGFRFDLASTLARGNAGVERLSPFFTAIQQDPVLRRAKLIAEPWDLGEGGYQVGNFPVGWSEWNDQYRDAARAYWKGDGGVIGNFARRLTGSSDLYGHDDRGPRAGVNFVTAHDGFTLHDLVSYNDKHNERNGEDNRDGTDRNLSWNCGVEGPSEDEEIIRLREAQKRNFLASLLLSQGVPMLQAGDEMGRTQDGNNNAYCQDNEISWMQWDLDEPRRLLLAFVREVIALRRNEPIFRRATFYDEAQASATADSDIFWLRPDGLEMTSEEWDNEFTRCIGVILSEPKREQADGGPESQKSFLLIVNAHHDDIGFTLPQFGAVIAWKPVLDTSSDAGVARDDSLEVGGEYVARARSLALLQNQTTSP